MAQFYIDAFDFCNATRHPEQRHATHTKAIDIIMAPASIVNDNARPVDIIGYDCGWGCADYGCEDGPAQLPMAEIIAALRKGGFAPHWRGVLGAKHLGNHAVLNDKTKTLPVLREALSRLYDATHSSAQQHRLPLVFGGDHSCAIGTWSGIINATQHHGKFGLIWIDAHMDAHTAETSHEGKWGGWWHGQPVAALTGHGLPEFTDLGSPVGAAAKISPKISPAHISIIGAHSFEPAEKKFTEKHGIRVYPLEEVKQRGFATVFAEAYTRATTGTQGWGMTLDLDSFHPDEAPGVGTFEDKGLTSAEVLPVLKGIAHKAGFSGLEIAEFNPHRDRNNKTVNLIEKLVEHIFTSEGSIGHTVR